MKQLNQGRIFAYTKRLLIKLGINNPNGKVLKEKIINNSTKNIRTMSELDQKLKDLDRAAATSDDALRAEFQTFNMDYKLNVPEDPWSDDYREEQLKLYELVAGRSYKVENEVSTFNVKEASNIPFPYQTQSCDTVGNHLIAIGFLIRTLALNANSKILEFGPGWGNTTEILVRMGHSVTAVDIEKNFTDLIDLRVKKLELEVNAINEDFSYINQLDEKYDVVLFFECFHHCADHLSLISSLKNVVNKDGVVVFAAEPITNDFPIPWGLRMDGESLWAIRKNGWMELGFTEDYFRETMRRNGWLISKHVCTDTPWGTIFIAKRG